MADDQDVCATSSSESATSESDKLALQEKLHDFFLEFFCGYENEEDMRHVQMMDSRIFQIGIRCNNKSDKSSDCRCCDGLDFMQALLTKGTIRRRRSAVVQENHHLEGRRRKQRGDAPLQRGDDHIQERDE